LAAFPKFYEQSRVPRWLSRFAPIEIEAISLGLFVFARGRLSARTRQHETIHARQWAELWFFGFAGLYLFYYLRERLAGLDGPSAYRAIPFEREAYTHEATDDYLETRPRLAWRQFRRTRAQRDD